jgi:hypothetical protein
VPTLGGARLAFRQDESRPPRATSRSASSGGRLISSSIAGCVAYMREPASALAALGDQARIPAFARVIPALRRHCFSGRDVGGEVGHNASAD